MNYTNQLGKPKTNANEQTARERGIYGGEDLQQRPEYAYAPGMEYVTPDGVRFSGGEEEQNTQGMAFGKGGKGAGKNIAVCFRYAFGGYCKGKQWGGKRCVSRSEKTDRMRSREMCR